MQEDIDPRHRKRRKSQPGDDQHVKESKRAALGDRRQLQRDRRDKNRRPGIEGANIGRESNGQNSK